MANTFLKKGYYILPIGLLFSITMCWSNPTPSEKLHVPTDPELDRLGTQIRQRLQLTADEKSWLEAKHLIHVRVGDYPPFHFILLENMFA